MRFGIILDGGSRNGNYHSETLDHRLQKARLSAILGFHSLWMGGGYLNHGWHGNLLLARVAAEAPGLALGLVGLIALTHPVEMAEQVSTLDAMCGGRFVLGAALGWRDHELRAFGLARSERLSRFRESLDVMKLLWTKDPVSYSGKHFHLDEVPGVTSTVSKPYPPIYIAANMDVGVARAGRDSDGWLISSRATLQTIRRQMPIYRNAAAEFGKPGAVTAWREMYVADSRQSAIATIKPYVETLYQHRSALGHSAELPKEDRIDVPFHQLINGRFILGSPEECIEQILQYSAAGIDEIVMRCQWPDMPPEDSLRAIKLFSEAVLPRFTTSHPATSKSV